MRCLDSLWSCSSVRFSSCGIAARAPTCICILTCFCFATGSAVCQTPAVAQEAASKAVSRVPAVKREDEMLIAAIIGVCVLLAVLGFLLPRLSTRPQHGVDRGLDAG